jgi:hypothetical protein
MSQSAGPALEQALACHRAPALLAAALSRPLPDQTLTLLRLAAGDHVLAAHCALACGESETEVVEAAAFFIQQVLFAPGADSYRVLGVNPDAPDERIKEHYRWLVRWLHPDRNTDDWDSVYADRVNVAWQTLRLRDRRLGYDQSRLAGAGLPVAAATPRDRALRNLPGLHDPPEPAMLSPGTVEKLPVIVLGGLGGVAVALLFLMWLGADRADRAGRAAPAAAVEAPVAQAEPRVAEPVAPLPALAPAATAPVDGAVADEPAAAAMPGPDPLPVADAPAEAAAAQSPAPVAAVPVAPAIVAPATVAPAAAAPVAAAPAAADSAVLQEAQARALLRRFSQAYEAGDIRTLMQLFTRDARNNRGGIEAIAYDYQSLFSATDSRELRLEPSGWMARDDGGTVLARYEAVVRVGGRQRPDVTQGDIRFDLRMENGVAKISVVTHD